MTFGRLFALRLTCSLLLSSLLVRGSSSQDFAHPPLDEYLATRDLVVKGTVVSATRTSHFWSGGCGFSSLGWTPRLWEVHIQPSQVILGVSDGSPLTITCREPYWADAVQSSVGKTVLAYAYRDCSDGWRLNGGIILIDAINGRLAPPPFEGGTLQPDSAYIATWPTFPILTQQLAPDAGLSSSQTFDGASAVALLSVTELILRPAEHGYMLRADSVRWLVGEGGRVPKFLRVPFLHFCSATPMVGDTLAIPLTGPSPDTLTISRCPQGYIARGGFLPSLNLDLSRPGDRMQIVAGQVRVLP